MKDTFYSVPELASILDLHPKTVRRLIREERIRGRKIGREWRVSQEDLREYAHGELRNDQPARAGSAADAAAAAGGGRIRVSAVIEIVEQDSEEASRISNSLMAMLNSKDPEWGPSRYDFIYHPEEGRARFVLYGTPAFIRNVMRVFEVIQGEDDR